MILGKGDEKRPDSPEGMYEEVGDNGGGEKSISILRSVWPVLSGLSR